MSLKTKRPKHLNLLKIRLPITGIASFFHRISGVILFLAIPASIYLFSLSLQSADGYDQVQTCLHSGWIQLGGLVLVWALAHHFFAGIRYLLIDLDMGVELKAARATAWTVTVLGGVFAVYAAVRWLL